MQSIVQPLRESGGHRNRAFSRLTLPVFYSNLPPSSAKAKSTLSLKDCALIQLTAMRRQLLLSNWQK
jgi:hypothetical protein